VTDDAAAPGLREARLRPEYAARHPGCPAGEWLPASTAAAYILAHREVLLGPDQAGADRALDPAAWEFRGEGRDRVGGRSSRRRFTDRHSGGHLILTQLSGSGNAL
jgi:hypothetical protein